ncbi:hypothetical protein [uncultured Aliiroseovarius sp.]|uniref:hypothetical protein n=1 Tax=uncultured Aliiroseovarius sp. TaxID=1658783 RepID=UPI00261C2657|nr:hypothetical protein [uncultured Aliiroseovarius sp.]
MEISNLVALQQQPDVLYLNGVPCELPRWASIEDRKDHVRACVNALTFAEMTAEELHIYFTRHSINAALTWNRQQSLIGRVLNRLTVPRPGYAKINGRVLWQVYEELGAQAGEAFAASAELYLRADIVAKIATLIQPKGADQ